MDRSKLSILSIDYSYAECGFAIFRNGELERVFRLNFKITEQKLGFKLKKKHKRMLLRERLKDINVDIIVLERVRTFSGGFISTAAIIALGELVVTIIDAVEIPVYSIDTRSWKKAFLGTSKSGSDKKTATILKAQTLLTHTIREKRKFRALTDNEADAVGIGVGFYNNVNIKEEE